MRGWCRLESGMVRPTAISVCAWRAWCLPGAVWRGARRSLGAGVLAIHRRIRPRAGGSDRDAAQIDAQTADRIVGIERLNPADPAQIEFTTVYIKRKSALFVLIGNACVRTIRTSKIYWYLWTHLLVGFVCTLTLPQDSATLPGEGTDGEPTKGEGSSKPSAQPGSPAFIKDAIDCLT